MKKYFKTAILNTSPIFFSYIFLGIAFGIMMIDAGLGPAWSGLMGVIVYTGAFQIAFTGLIKAGASMATICITAAVMGSRHIFYGFSFLEDFRKEKRLFPYLAFSLTDESYALDCSLKVPQGLNRQRLEFLIHILCQSYWVTGCILGGLIGRYIPFDFTGIDFCMTALFISIMVDQWRSVKSTVKDHLPAITGVVSAVLYLWILGPSDFLFPAMLTTTVILLLVSLAEIKEAE